MNFNQKTIELLRTSSHGRIGSRNFQKIFPSVAAQVRHDRGTPWLQRWGKSRNVDEHENSLIVDPKILSLIGRHANCPIRDGDAYHAGLLHTYGYLFSCLKTRYGYKRERWTRNTLETGFGLPKKSFSPSPDTGTLLSNITQFLCRVSIEPNFQTQTTLDTKLNPFIVDYEYRRLKIHRITENIKVSRKPISVVTDLVQFPNPTQDHFALLIYSCRSSKQQKLFTCFPIPNEVYKNLLDNARKNETPITLRFNAILPGFPQDGCKGTREIAVLKL